MEKKNLKTWIEIDAKAIRKNYKNLRALLSEKTKFMAVVKANAYGHGIISFSEEMEKLGADYLAVFDFGEALALRKNNIKIPILVLGSLFKKDFTEIINKNIEITVSNFEMLNALSKIKSKKKIKIHLKVDTGLGRQGFLLSDMQKVLKILEKKSSIKLVGLYTHFSIAENPSEIAYTRRQVERLKIWQSELQKRGFSFLTHAGASSAIMFGPELHFDLVRAGISIYGLWPDKVIKNYAEKKISLVPTLSWKTVVNEIKKAPKGSAISYDMTETVKRDSTLAILPVGYWDGYPRALSSIGQVIIKGKKAKIIGRICMNMCVVDITDIPNVKTRDEVFLIGGEKENCITAEEVAEKTESINYEVVTRINPLIPRIYL